MPIYEYVCSKCSTTAEIFRRMDERNMPMVCLCGMTLKRIYSVPVMQAWNADRSFPNAVAFGDGKFPTKAAYESHLKAHDIAESRTDGKIYRPHGNRVIRRG